MTEAESSLIDAMLSAEYLRISTAGTGTLDISDCLSKVAAERVHPEARAKFDALYARHTQTQKELFAFVDTLPRLVTQRWWSEAEKAGK